MQYDFSAERPDELDAKKGEPIVVIAQSNHEWCVVPLSVLSEADSLQVCGQTYR